MTVYCGLFHLVNTAACSETCNQVTSYSPQLAVLNPVSTGMCLETHNQVTGYSPRLSFFNRVLTGLKIVHLVTV